MVIWKKKIVILYLGKYSVTCLFIAYCSANDFVVHPSFQMIINVSIATVTITRECGLLSRCSD